MLEFLGYLWLFFVYAWIAGFATIQLYKWNQKRNDEKFLRYLKIRFPDSKDITLSSVASSDEEALTNIKEQLDEL